MSRSIPYPHRVKPARVTQQLLRIDEIFGSPLSNVQQVVFRPAPAWSWTFEYKDLSLEEKDIVAGFLMSCQGAVNDFLVRDSSRYYVSGTASSWTDLLGGAGDFDSVNSDFGGNTSASKTFGFTKRGTLRKRHDRPNSYVDIRTSNFSVAGSIGRAYVARLQFYPQTDSQADFFCAIRVSTDTALGADYGETVNNPNGPALFTFVPIDSDFECAGVIRHSTADAVGKYWDYDNFNVSRCLLVDEKENLLKFSEDFEQSDWTKTRAQVQSGYNEHPFGSTVGSAGYKMFVGTQTNSTYYMDQDYTKSNTEDIYTVSAYFKKAEIERVRLSIRDGGTSGAFAIAHLNTGTIYSVGSEGFAHTDIKNMGDGWYRVSVTARTSSDASVGMRVLLINSDGNSSFTGNGSAGLYIMGAQLEQSALMGRYTTVTSEIAVGSLTVTGSVLYAKGAEADELVLGENDRIEVVTKMTTASSREVNEFKRVTADCFANADGTVAIPIEPPLRYAPEKLRSRAITGGTHQTLENPVIIDRPTMRARLAAGTVQFIEKDLQMFDVTFDVIEDLTQ